MTVKNWLRKIIINLGVKSFFIPVMDFLNKGKTATLMKRYDPVSLVYGLNTEKRDVNITVSFTTYPPRIDAAKYVADTMLRQTVKPDRVIMVLSKEEYLSKESLPTEYKNLELRGLTIVFDEGLKPHNKYHYAMRHFFESLIITVDDDVFYPENLIETLVRSYQKYPSAISALRTHRMLFDGDALRPYNDWDFESTYTDQPAFDLIATGGAGVLYPPHCFAAKRELLFDASVIKATCLGADDIWLKFMELLCDIPVVNASLCPSSLLTVPNSQKHSLSSKNVDKRQNDIAIQNIMRHLDIDAKELFRHGKKVESEQ